LSRIEHLAEGVTLYLGDCREILPTLGRVPAIVTDPPYGIGADAAAASSALQRIKADGKSKAGRGWKFYGETDWDADRPAMSVMLLLQEISDYQIVWGGNYFTDILPQTMQWLIWDKGQRDFSLADFEMAWSSQKAASRIFDYPRALALKDGKEHPTQKPVEVMRWCLSFIPAKCKTIVDPFMGSGTTGVAAVQTSRGFIGIERSEAYFDIACRRIQAALDAPDMFVEAPKPAKQEAML
jgi:DNA modification methylase